jgi:hypothetical protein
MLADQITSLSIPKSAPDFKEQLKMPAFRGRKIKIRMKSE